MKKLLILCVVLAGVLVWLLFLTEFGTKKDGGSGSAVRQSAQKAEEQKGSATTHESPFAKFIHDPEDKLLESPISTGAEGVLSKSISERKNSVYTFVPPGVPVDVPIIELRFFREGSDSALSPLYVQHAYIMPWENGKTVSGKDGEMMGGMSIKANAFRVGVSDLKDPVYKTFLTGRTYYIQLCPKKGTFEPDPELGETFEVLFQVPESIPDNKMAVVNIVAKYRYPKLLAKMKKLRGDGPKSIKGQIIGPVSMNTKTMQAGYFPQQGRSKRVKVGGDRAFKLKADKLGGMLRLTEMKSVAVGWVYINSVRERDLQLPQDADLVVPPEDLVPFKLNIPPGKINDDLEGVSIKVKKDDPMPMAWVNFDRSHEHILQGLQKTGTLDMEFIPGEWFVEVMYWPEGTEWSERRLETLGTVRVKKSHAGKTLKVQSLEE